MIHHVDTGHAIRLACRDARDREFDLIHFTGDDLLSLNLTRTRDHRLHLSPQVAASLRDALDHFTRHHQLPSCMRSVEDWSI